MKKHTLSVALFIFASPALAADPMFETPVASTYNWSGAYLGAQVGYGWGDGLYMSPLDGQSALPEPDGVFGGLHAGYNFQLNNSVVLGFEGDFNWHDADDLAPFGPVVFTDTRFDLEWSGSIRGRLGYAIDRFLPYLTGGVAFGHLTHDVALIADPRVPAESFEDTMIGWTAGAGLEYALTDKLTSRLEYRYTDFGSDDYVGAVAFPHTVEFQTHDVRIGVSYKF